MKTFQIKHDGCCRNPEENEEITGKTIHDALKTYLDDFTEGASCRILVRIGGKFKRFDIGVSIKYDIEEVK